MRSLTWESPLPYLGTLLLGVRLRAHRVPDRWVFEYGWEDGRILSPRNGGKKKEKGAGGQEVEVEAREEIESLKNIFDWKLRFKLGILSKFLVLSWRSVSEIPGPT